MKQKKELGRRKKIPKNNFKFLWTLRKQQNNKSKDK